MARPLHELINLEEPAWPLVLEWMAGARNPVEILPTARGRGEAALLALQVTTRSPMGAIALESGGLLVDSGWLRILGAGCERLQGSLTSWNGLQPGLQTTPLEGALVVAHDAGGGFFAINAGAFDGPTGQIVYFVPERLAWENLNLSYSQFLGWAFSGDLNQFYGPDRWPGWQSEIAGLAPDQGMHFWPPPWSREGKDRAAVSRRPVAMTELWRLYVRDGR